MVRLAVWTEDEPSNQHSIFTFHHFHTQYEPTTMLTISGSQWFGPMLGTNELVKPKWKWKSLRSAEWTELHLVLIYSDIIYVHLVYPGLTTRDEFTSARLVQRVLESLILMLPWLFVWAMIWTSHKLVSHINLGGQNCTQYYILLFCSYSKQTLMYSYDSQFDQYIGIVAWFLPNIIIFG